jgi:hypothetical protein|tara:strand:+ start:467 stop:724 length:258 start_codon:yes stop_codon:yes gene_type:complete
MRKTTTKDIIIKYIQSQHPRPVAGYELVNQPTSYGWLGSSADRKARELAAIGLLSRQYATEDGVQYVYYTITNPEPDKRQGRLFE